jgi:hypothetical protein
MYLDGVFVDMMWYKAFSVWLMLKLQMNVLFQDIDIVWFKSPFPYFHEFIQRAQAVHDPTGQRQVVPDAFLSDDGQRSTVRYSPFYANSGFYYFIANEKTLNVAWNIMLTFDVMQSSGSHQNVFTQRLLEGLDIAKLHTQSMHQDNFTNGASYHHRPGFMAQIREHKVLPYMFHMCWTANKTQKLDFFRNTHMWFLQDHLSSKAFIPGGLLESVVRKAEPSTGSYDGEAARNRWAGIGKKVCHVMPDAPRGNQ